MYLRKDDFISVNIFTSLDTNYFVQDESSLSIALLNDISSYASVNGGAVLLALFLASSLTHSLAYIFSRTSDVFLIGCQILQVLWDLAAQAKLACSPA
jgi:hypothetical protein